MRSVDREGELEARRRVFLSYGRDEYVPLVERLKRDLDSCGRYAVWSDWDRLRAGFDWEVTIEEGLKWVAATPGEGRMILMLTPHAVRRSPSDTGKIGYCLKELSRAERLGVRVVPVLVADCELPLSIERAQYVDFRDCLPLDDRLERWSVRLAQLLYELEATAGSQLPEPAEDPADLVRKAFELADTAGRLDEAVDILARVLERWPALGERYQADLNLWQRGIVM